MVRDKVRIRFRKDGPLRLVSHHDLMRCFERMLRRASLPYHSTQGFNPKPRLVFALSLGLGIVGRDEVVELELDDELPVHEIEQRLVAQAPPGLTIHSMRRVPPRSTAQVRRVCYRMAIPETRRSAIADRIPSIVNATECWIERSRPQPRRFDARPYLRDIKLSEDALELDLWVTPTGTVRPDEVLEVLGADDILADGATLERTVLELHDECPEAAEASSGSGVPGTPEISIFSARESDKTAARAASVAEPTIQQEGNA